MPLASQKAQINAAICLCNAKIGLFFIVLRPYCTKIRVCFMCKVGLFYMQSRPLFSCCTLDFLHTITLYRRKSLYSRHLMSARLKL